ncbi:hypothetical protein N5I08_07895 [Acinetobacter johnsonii]|uniref:hypothetical protein n=1 Tax=Acinetobacter johnsonii TaxID=40214 RepID=UPI00244B7673|nr:hypothetical protein [Acinetobacter johnsonii]MDH1518945.1 hypothetical protein [Acinetobacter johnsonii]
MYEETEEIVVFLQCLQTKALAHKKPETTPFMLYLTVLLRRICSHGKAGERVLIQVSIMLLSYTKEAQIKAP